MQKISKTIHIWYPQPKQYTVDCCIIYLQKMYLPPISPLVFLFPLSNLPYTVFIVVRFTAASYDVDCWDDTILPRSTTAVLYARLLRIQHIVVFIVIATTMVSQGRRHGNWCKLHDAVDCCMLDIKH